MNHSGSPGIRAVDVWDVLVASITTVGSIGEVLDDLTAAKIAFIDAAISAGKLSAYSYGPTSLANGAAYAPAAGTIVLHAYIDNNISALDDWSFALKVSTEESIDTYGATQKGNEALNYRSISAVMYCDGTASFRNDVGVAADITLWGLSIA